MQKKIKKKPHEIKFWVPIPVDDRCSQISSTGGWATVWGSKNLGRSLFSDERESQKRVKPNSEDPDSN